jgi:hypothetical protein
MSQPSSRPVPPQRRVVLLGNGVTPPRSMQRRVQSAVLQQFAELGSASRSATAAICPGTDRRDLEAALEYLIAEGSIAGPTWRLDSLAEIAESGGLTLTAAGQVRIQQDPC